MYVGLILSMAGGAWAGECTVDALRESLETSVDAFSRMDADRFGTASESVAKDLDCLTAPLTPQDSARLHLNRGLASFLSEDAPATILAFRAAISADPSVQLPEQVAPPGHPLTERFRTAEQWAPSQTFVRLPPPRRGWLQVDGQRAKQVPTDRPYIFQHLVDDQTVVESAYLSPGDAIPAYASVRETTRSARKPLSANTKRGLVIAGVALGTVGLASYGGAFATNSAYQQAKGGPDDARTQRLYHANNGLTVGGVIGMVAGTGLVVVGRL